MCVIPGRNLFLAVLLTSSFLPLQQTSPTKTISGSIGGVSGVIATAIRPLRMNGSPRVSPSPHNSPSPSPRASPTPSRHLPQSPSHTTAHSSCSSLTTASSRNPSSGNSIGRQPNSSTVLVRGSESLSERDRYRGLKIRQKPTHHQSSDSGIVSRDSSSSNEFPNDGHSGSPEPVVPGNNHTHTRPSPPCDLRVSEMSPTGSTDSPTAEDIKLVCVCVCVPVRVCVCVHVCVCAYCQ